MLQLTQFLNSCCKYFHTFSNFYVVRRIRSVFLQMWAKDVSMVKRYCHLRSIADTISTSCYILVCTSNPNSSAPLLHFETFLTRSNLEFTFTWYFRYFPAYILMILMTTESTREVWTSLWGSSCTTTRACTDWPSSSTTSSTSRSSPPPSATGARPSGSGRRRIPSD